MSYAQLYITSRNFELTLTSVSPIHFCGEGEESPTSLVERSKLTKC